MAYLYRHIRLDKNEPFYVGVGADDEGVYKRAYAKDGRNKLWHDVVRKTDYDVEIMVDDISFDESRRMEIWFIAFYGKKINGGILCNLTDGGEGWLGLVHSEETKRRIGEKKMGKPSPMKGKQSQIRGERHGMFGKTHSDELKAKWAITRKGATAWNKGKTGMTYPNANHKKKSVIQYDKDMRIVCEYESLGDAAKQTGFRKGSICKAILGLDRMKSHKGFVWKYKEAANETAS